MLFFKNLVILIRETDCIISEYKNKFFVDVLAKKKKKNLRASFVVLKLLHRLIPFEHMRMRCPINVHTGQRIERVSIRLGGLLTINRAKNN